MGPILELKETSAFSTHTAWRLAFGDDDDVENSAHEKKKKEDKTKLKQSAELWHDWLTC